MRPRRSVVAVLAVAAMIVLRTIPAAAASTLSLAYSPDANPWSLAPGEYYTELSGSSFAATSYYDQAADRVPLGLRYQSRAFRSYTELGWKKRLSVQLSLPLVTNSVRVAMPGGVANSGLEDFGFGLRYRLQNGATASSLQLRWEAPTGYNSGLLPAVGDGRQKLSLSLQAGRNLGPHSFAEAGIGERFDFRGLPNKDTHVNTTYGPIQPVSATDDWAAHTTVHVAYARWIGRVLLAGTYDAALHLSTGRPYKIADQAAGPRVTYRVDDRLDAFAGSWHTPWGRNTLHFDEYYAGIAWRSTKLNRLQGFLGGDRR
jgi:hypothetical protein